MTERCEDLDHVYPVAYGVPDTPRAVDSDALAFWQQITSSTLSEGRHGPACEFATLLPGNGDPYLRVQAVVGNRAECHPKVETFNKTLREKRALKSGLLRHPRYHLPDYESFRGSLSGAASPVSLRIGAEL